MARELPGDVRALARRLGALAANAPSTVHLSQIGRMRQDAGSSWRRFTAEQTISSEKCEFDWIARTGPGRLIKVQDALIDGRGRLEVRAVGLFPIARAGGSPELTRGELMRYLAELAWAPDAISNNPHLHWQVDAPDRLVVRGEIGSVVAQLTLELDSSGRVASTFAPDRPRAVGKALIPTPWRGRFFDYRLHEGRWIPFGGEVGWVTDGSDEICWQGKIERWTATRANGR
jgi:hypothetical protein